MKVFPSSIIHKKMTFSTTNFGCFFNWKFFWRM